MCGTGAVVAVFDVEGAVAALQSCCLCMLLMFMSTWLIYGRVSSDGVSRCSLQLKAVGVVI